MERDRERLLKFLNMTASEHDAEVITSIRKANELLRLHKLTWAEFLRPPSEESAQPERNRPKENHPHSASRRGRRDKRISADRFVARIRTVPLWIRVLFAPLTAGAETLALMVLQERSSVARGFGLLGCLSVALLVGAVWMAVLMGLIDTVSRVIG